MPSRNLKPASLPVHPAGRRPLVFASTEREAEALARLIACARRFRKSHPAHCKARHEGCGGSTRRCYAHDFHAVLPFFGLGFDTVWLAPHFAQVPTVAESQAGIPRPCKLACMTMRLGSCFRCRRVCRSVKKQNSRGARLSPHGQGCDLCRNFNKPLGFRDGPKAWECAQTALGLSLFCACLAPAQEASALLVTCMSWHVVGFAVPCVLAFCGCRLCCLPIVAFGSARCFGRELGIQEGYNSAHHLALLRSGSCGCPWLLQLPGDPWRAWPVSSFRRGTLRCMNSVGICGGWSQDKLHA